MRQKRAKAYRKLMQVYSMSFGFRQPYQVLVDSEMCKEAVAHKIDLIKQLGSVLQGDLKPMITQCCIHELYLQGKSHQPAVDLAKNFERRKCNHREPISGDECLQSVIGGNNKHRYVVATQSHALRTKLRNIPATPLVHFTRSVMILEPISDVTLTLKETNEEGKLHATAPDLALVSPQESSEPPKKRRKGPKGPNPLSVKKKKPTLVPGPQQPTTTSKRTTSEQLATAGNKRKQNDGESEPEIEHDEDTVAENISKKRKRRKKSHSAFVLPSVVA